MEDGRRKSLTDDDDDMRMMESFSFCAVREK